MTIKCIHVRKVLRTTAGIELVIRKLGQADEGRWMRVSEWEGAAGGEWGWAPALAPRDFFLRFYLFIHE